MLTTRILRMSLVAVLMLVCSAVAQPPNIVPGSFICQVVDSEDALLIGQRAVEATGGTLGHVYTHAIKGFSIHVPPGIVVANLVAQPGIIRAEPDLIMHTCAEVPTGVDRIDAEQAASVDCSGVGIAIIDSGIDIDHDDLTVLGGRRFYTQATGPPWNRSVIDDGNYDDDYGHGTHCAGIAAANGGIVGVAPGAGLYAVKVLGSNGSGYMSDIIAGVDWVTANAEKLEPPIRFANMSLGGQGESQLLYEAMEGCPVTFTVSAGNSHKDIYGSDGAFGGGDDFIPAAYGGQLDNVLTISALADSDGKPGGFGGDTSFGPDDSFATFSNYSADGGIAYMLPGVDIKSTYMGGGYAIMSGTSMAAPHAAGLLALDSVASGSLILVSQTDSRGLAILNDPDGHPEPLAYSIYGLDTPGNIPPTADFTYATDESDPLTVDFLNVSSDPDGFITNWAWDFGDGTSATGTSTDLLNVNPTHTYTEAGTYSVTLTVTDDAGATDALTQDVTVGSASSETIGVSDIAFANAGPHLKMTVTIADSSGNPVSGATVDADLDHEGSLIATLSGVTDSLGQVTFTRKRAETGTYTLTVVDVTHSTYEWDHIEASDEYTK